MEALKSFGIRKKSIIIFLLLLTIFFILRIPALNEPYHQDEYKWAMAVGFEESSSPSIPHPPLTRFLYLIVSTIFGNDNLRFMPLAASLLSLFIIFYIVKRYYSLTAAFLAALLFTVVPYSVLGSVQIDIDGAVLPMFSLITILGYLLSKETNFRDKRLNALIVFGMVGGFLSKLSFIIIPVTLAIHFLYERYSERLKDNKFVAKMALSALFVLLGLVLVVLPFKDVVFLRYIKNFTNILDRNFAELAFLSLKAVIYLSPMLLVVAIFALKDCRKLSLWYIFLLNSILFYAVIFDFTHRTLDRYWMILILPLTIIAAAVISKVLEDIRKKDVLLYILAAILTFVVAISIFNLPHEVIPLNPKANFILALTSLSWDILIPLSGGSGPLGFYVSLLGIAVFWSISAITCLFLLNQRFRRNAAIILISISSVYSLIIVNEYLNGSFYGKTSRVLAETLEYIEVSEIPKVITYNDTGAYELLLMDKYHKRFYADPAFVESNREKFASFDGHYMMVDFPKINHESFYWQYFESCQKEFEVKDKQISGYIFLCKGHSR